MPSSHFILLFFNFLLCWPRIIDNRLRLLLQQSSEFAQLFERIAKGGESGEDRPQQIQKTLPTELVVSPVESAHTPERKSLTA